MATWRCGAPQGTTKHAVVNMRSFKFVFDSTRSLINEVEAGCLAATEKMTLSH